MARGAEAGVAGGSGGAEGDLAAGSTGAAVVGIGVQVDAAFGAAAEALAEGRAGGA